MKTPGCTLSTEDAEKIVLSRFNEDNPCKHQIKLLFDFGVFTAFQGINEHLNLSPSHIKLCRFPQNHIVPQLAGTEYICVTCIPNDKTNKLSVHQSHVVDTSDLFKIPVDHSDPDSFGASVVRFLGKLSPGQDRMYCKIADPVHRATLTKQGFPNALFMAHRHCGEKAVRALFKEGAKMLGLSADFRPHSLRGACITKLVNSPDVSLAETMAVARHSSVSASRQYQRVDSVSEANRFKALGLLGQSTPKDVADVGGLKEEYVEDAVKVEEGSAEVPKESSSCCSSSSDSDDDTLLLVDYTTSQRKKIRVLNSLVAKKDKKIAELERQNKELFRIVGAKYGVTFAEEDKIKKKRKKSKKSKK